MRKPNRPHMNLIYQETKRAMSRKVYITRDRSQPRRRDAQVATVAVVRIAGYGLIWMGLLLLSVAAIAATLGRLLPPL